MSLAFETAAEQVARSRAWQTKFILIGSAFVRDAMRPVLSLQRHAGADPY
jgi:hypothetical protein